jgi:hypothetical protein
MARTGLWKVWSGAFAGWRDGEHLYDSKGCHAGYFREGVAYSKEGQYIGEIYRDDWLGKREDVARSQGSVSCTLDSISAAPLDSRAGLDVPGWSDPNL